LVFNAVLKSCTVQSCKVWVEKEVDWVMTVLLLIR
jgi:hypothetical protein